MDFALSEDQRAIEDAARAFAAAELAPHSARWDEEKHFPVETLRQAAALGFAGVYVQRGRRRLGASPGSTPRSSSRPWRAGDVSTAAFLSIHNMASWMIDRFGVDDLRRRYPAAPDHHGADRLLLPDRARRRLGRRRAAHHRPARRRRPMC